MLTPTEKPLIRIVIRCKGLDDAQQDAIGQSDDLARQYIADFRPQRLSEIDERMAECDVRIQDATAQKAALLSERNLWA